MPLYVPPGPYQQLQPQIEKLVGQIDVALSAAITNPMTTLGDVVYGGASGAPTRLAGNTTTTKKFLRQTGNGTVSAAPAWDVLVAGDIPDLSAIYQPLDGDLSAIAALSGTAGLLRKTAANTWSLDTSIVSSQWVTSGANIYYLTGNVGINVMAPSEKLEVNGRVKFTPTLTTFDQIGQYTSVVFTPGADMPSGTFIFGADDLVTGAINFNVTGPFIVASQGAVALTVASGKTVSQVYGARYVLDNAGAGTITTAARFYAAKAETLAGGGAITNLYGLLIDDVDLGAANFAIKTGTGPVWFGDKVGIGTNSASAKLHTLSTTEQLRLGFDSGNYASFTVGAAGNLTVAPSGDFIFNPAGKDILPHTTYDLNLGSTTKKYLAAHIAELRAETLIAQETIATIGGRAIISSNSSLLIAPLAAAATTIDVKHNGLASGDRIYLETIGQVEWIAITSGATSITGGYRYSVTRDLDGTGANDWDAGATVVNTGTTGSGFIDMYSIRSIKSATQAGPTIVGNIRNSSTYNDFNEQWAIGNLKGLYGYGANTMGVAFGKYDGLTAFITIDNTNGYRTWAAGPVVVQQIDNSGTITVGEVGAGKSNVRITSGAVQLRHNTTARISLAADGSGFLANSNIAWDTSGNLTMIGGAIIAGWTVNNGHFTKDTGTNSTSAGMAPADYPFFAGATYANRATATFRVTPAGALTATSGAIGGWSLTSTDIRNSGGTVILRGTGNLAFGTTPPTSASSGTGLFQDGTGIYGLSGGTVQAKFDAATGQIIAGGGGAAVGLSGFQAVAGTVYAAAGPAYLNVDALGGNVVSSFFDTVEAAEHNTFIISNSLAGKDTGLLFMASCPSGKGANILLSAAETSGNTATLEFGTSGLLSYYSGGIARFTVDASGNAAVYGYTVMSSNTSSLLIGTASPHANNYSIDARRTTFAQLYLQGGSAADFLLYHSGAATNAKFIGFRNQSGLGGFSSFVDSGASYQKQNILCWDNLTGNVGLGNPTLPTGGGTPVLALAQASGNPTGIGSNSAGLIAKDVSGTAELFAWDEAGNVTQISPHAMDAPAWLYDVDDPLPQILKEENLFLGVRRWTNKSRQARLLERFLAGEDLSQLTKEERTFIHVERFKPTLTWEKNQAAQKTAREDAILSWRDRKTAHEAELSEWKKLPSLQKRDTPKPRFNDPQPQPFTAKPVPTWLKARLNSH